MTVVHIVQFAFKDSASESDIRDAVRNMLALREQCVHPTSKTPYMVSAVGGRNNSPEGLNKGLTHGFVMSFASTEDRDYYLDRDPAHQEFKKAVKPLVADICVVDFEPEAS